MAWPCLIWLIKYFKNKIMFLILTSPRWDLSHLSEWKKDLFQSLYEIAYFQVEKGRGGKRREANLFSAYKKAPNSPLNNEYNFSFGLQERTFMNSEEGHLKQVFQTKRTIEGDSWYIIRAEKETAPWPGSSEKKILALEGEQRTCQGAMVNLRGQRGPNAPGTGLGGGGDTCTHTPFTSFVVLQAASPGPPDGWKKLGMSFLWPAKELTSLWREVQQHCSAPSSAPRSQVPLAVSWLVAPCESCKLMGGH